MKFRKKPVIIEAIEVKDLVAEFFQRKALWPSCSDSAETQSQA